MVINQPTRRLKSQGTSTFSDYNSKQVSKVGLQNMLLLDLSKVRRANQHNSKNEDLEHLDTENMRGCHQSEYLPINSSPVVTREAEIRIKKKPLQQVNTLDLNQ